MQMTGRIEITDDPVFYRERIPKVMRSAIIHLYSGKCQYCGAKNANHIDHIVPVSKGGEGVLENLTLACEACNIRKSDLELPDAYLGLLIARAVAKKPAIMAYMQKADSKLQSISVVQSRMARAALGWGVRDLAAEADIATTTVSRFEAGAGVHSRTVDALRAAFEKHGVRFTEAGVEAPELRRSTSPDQ